MTSAANNVFPIALAVLSVVLLLAISGWKLFKVRRWKEFVRRQMESHTLSRYSEDYNPRVRMRRQQAREAKVQIWMTVVVTVALGAAALYIILSNRYEQDSLKWAYGTLGTVIRYWLKK